MTDDLVKLRADLERLTTRHSKLVHRVSTADTRREARSLRKQIRDLSGRIAHLERKKT